ncbi:MlaD family protein [Undibacterium sp. SXout7W]|uniref:MlaD family protein n=1 Tax=Undibacterium sp. SXout7W TaxID=3413049 RepID=UPI003BF069D3
MENRSHALMAGFFTIALMSMAIVLGIWLGRDKIQRVPYEIVTNMTVSGLNLQAAVRYKGIKVGNVTDISFDPKVPGQLVLRLEVIPDTPITKATFATLGYQGVTGIAFIQLDEDLQAGTGATLLTADASGQAQRISLRASSLQTLEQKGMAILKQTEDITRKLNIMLDPDNKQSVAAAINHIGQAAAAWQTVPSQLAPTLNKLPVLLDQTQSTLSSVQHLSSEANTLAANLTQLSQRVQAQDGPLVRFNMAIDQMTYSLTQETLPRIQNVTGEARSSLRSLNRATDQLSERPQSILFGNPAPLPGPGEAGFVAPR